MMKVTRYEADDVASQHASGSMLATHPASVRGAAGGAGLGYRLLSLACAIGGALRNTVYVTLDALRGRYDH